MSHHCDECREHVVKGKLAHGTVQIGAVICIDGVNERLQLMKGEVGSSHKTAVDWSVWLAASQQR